MDIYTHSLAGFSFDVEHYSWIVLFATRIQIYGHTKTKDEEEGEVEKMKSRTRNKSEPINEEQNNQTTKQTHIYFTNGILP